MAARRPSSFGGALRRFRERAGLTQEELAERAGLSAAAIGALERGERRRPYPHTVRLLAQALGLDEASRASLIATARATRETASGDDDRRPRAADSDSSPRIASHQTVRGPDTNPFVGRRDELSRLTQRLGDAITTQGRVIMLAGEAGIGKTRLAREFASQAAAKGVCTLVGSCFEGDWHPPYGPWVEALSAYVRERPPAELNHELGAAASAVGQLIPAVREVLPDLALPPPLSSDEERFRLYDSVIQFLRAISRERPLLLTLDDLHWADADSLRLLRYLGRCLPGMRILVLGIYRDPEPGLNEAHPLMEMLSVLRREAGYERITLRGFEEGEMTDYLSQSAGGPLPREVIRAIEEESGGNPFYAREVVRHLGEEARREHGDSTWASRARLGERGSPEGVRQVVSRRVALLSEKTRELLRLASGFTSGFRSDVLESISGQTEDVFLTGLDEALQAGFLRASGQRPPRYEFSHSIVRNALYQSLNPERRTRLHRRIAVALDQTRSGGEVEDSAELAAQYHASIALPGASHGVAHALRAAEHARGMYAYDKAAGYLRLARELAAEATAEVRADVLRRLAVAEAEALDLGRALRSVAEALDAMDASGTTPRDRAALLVRVTRALKDGGADAAAWGSLVAQGLGLVGATHDLLWARLRLLEDHFERVQSGPLGGSRWLGNDPQAVAIARSEGDEEDYARSLEPLEPRKREETEAVLRLARSWTLPMAALRGLELAGRDLLYRHGLFREALGVYEELRAASERLGSIPTMAEALTHIATSQIAMGDLPGGQQTMRRALEVIPRLGPGHRIYAWAPLSRACFIAYFLDGDWPDLAKQATEYATSDAAHASPVGFTAAAIASHAEVRAGNVPGARELLSHLTDLQRRIPQSTYAQSTTLAWAASAVWELQEVGLAEPWRRLALDQMGLEFGDTGLGPLDLFVARMAALLRDFAEAEERFGRARGQLREAGRPHLAAVVDHDEAWTLILAADAANPRIESLLRSAEEGFRSHGMQGWIARAARLRSLISDGGPRGRGLRATPQSRSGGKRSEP